MSKSSVYSIRVSYQLLNAIFEELDSREIAFNSVSGALVSFIENKISEQPILSDEEAIERVAERVSLCGKQTRAKKASQALSTSPSSRGSSKVRTAVSEASRFLGSPTTDLDFSPSSFNSNFELLDKSGDQRELQDSGFGLDEVLEKGQEIIRQQTEQLDQDASDDLEQILQDSIAELERENSLALLDKLTGNFKVAKATELPAVSTKLDTISPRDPRLEKDKFWKAFSGEADEAKMYALRIVYFNLPEDYWSSEKAEKMLVQLMENLS